MKIKNFTIGVVLVSTIVLMGCGNDNNPERENVTEVNSEISGIDYRVIMDKNVNSIEVKEFFVKNKISAFKQYLDIDTDENQIITNIDFKEACPAEYMPFGANSIMNRELVEKIYGKPDRIIDRTYIYHDMQFGIQFNQDGESIQDLGVFSIIEYKKRWPNVKL
jgi:hypothetical protein